MMKVRRFVITTVYRCIDCPFLSEGGPYKCHKTNATFEGEPEPERGWWNVRNGVASFCPLQKVEIEETAKRMGIDLEEDDLFKVLARFTASMERQIKSTLKDEIEEVAPRCPSHGSLVHKQRGGRIYNKRCPKCSIPLVAKRQSREPGSNIRWVFYYHPNVPLRKSD